MSSPLDIDIITIFPRVLDGFLEESILKRAVEAGAVRFKTIDLRDFTFDNHRSVDDRPYGGGPGMVMKCEPLYLAVESLRRPESRVLFMTPQGRPFQQKHAETLSREQHLIILCGHYEGVDERVRQDLVDEEISIGDFVLTNGVLPAAVVADAVTRLLPGVLGHEDSAGCDSFSDGLLEYPQYTRPAEFRGMNVPDILLSGDHGSIAAWRHEQSLERTRCRRPDLLKNLENPENSK